MALAIAGSDSSGGAGIQADLKTFEALRVYGASVLTAITAQNTREVRAIHAIPPDMVAAQIEAVLDDLDIGAIKIGMVFSAEIIGAIAAALARYPDIPVVLDPVMVATSGDRLIDESAIDAIRTRLLHRATCITPNLAEAALMTGTPVAQDEAAMVVQAKLLQSLGARSVLVKGGHGAGSESTDILLEGGSIQRFATARIDSRNLHGTGCTLSSAIAAGLSKQYSLDEAISAAKAYVTGAIAAGATRRIGHGHGPLHHAFQRDAGPYDFKGNSA